MDWQTDDSSFGEDQVRENKINDGIYCSVYGSMTDGEEMDCYQALRNHDWTALISPMRWKNGCSHSSNERL